MSPEFVTDYLVHATSVVRIRVLTKKGLDKTLPAIAAFSQQYGNQVEVRSCTKLHDRHVFVDNAQCFHSGASFKDGPQNAPTTIAQVVDAFAATLATYEKIWAHATVRNEWTEQKKAV
jgi:hypothetical protein